MSPASLLKETKTLFKSNFINKLGYKSYYFDGSDLKSTEILKDLNSKNNYNHEEEVLGLLNKINKTIEKWILKCPEQWLWIHNNKLTS